MQFLPQAAFMWIICFFYFCYSHSFLAIQLVLPPPVPLLPCLCPLHTSNPPSLLSTLAHQAWMPSCFHWVPICGLLTKKSCGTIELLVVTEATLTAEASGGCSFKSANRSHSVHDPSTQREPSRLPLLPLRPDCERWLFVCSWWCSLRI